jgi:2-oxoglutarate ferredoxin oxidoreductase subunit beta
MDVQMHDGSHLRIRKLQRDYDPTNRSLAQTVLAESDAKGEVLTGVLYVDTQKPTFIELLGMSAEPLATLPQSVTRPPKTVLDQVMEELR